MQGKGTLTNPIDTMIGNVRVEIDRTGSLIDLTYCEQTVTVTRSELERIAELLATVTK